MNTLRFYSKEELAPELHNLQSSYKSKVSFFDKEVNMWQPCNLHIFIHKEVNDKTYFMNLSKVLDEIQKYKIEVSLTDINSEEDLSIMLKVIKECNKRKLDFRTVNIKEKLLLSKINGIEIYKHLVIEGCINCIDITKRDFDDRTIERLYDYFKLQGGIMRLSFPVYDNSMELLNKTIDYYLDRKITDLIFREKDISLKDIFNEEGYLFIRKMSNPFYTVKVYQYKNCIAKYYETKEIVNEAISSMMYKDGELLCKEKVIL